MKAEDLEKSITFRDVRHTDQYHVLTARLEVGAMLTYSVDEIKDHPEAIAYMREKLSETIMRRIYDDQREMFYEAMMDFYKTNPMDYTALDEARAKLLKVAMRQKP